MKLRKIALITLCLFTCFLSCKKDDDATIEPVPLRDRDEQQIADKDSLEVYLKSHYYNSSEFESITNPTIDDLIITKLAEGETEAPDGSTILEESTKLDTLEIDYADTKYECYVLSLKQGGGSDSPTFSDNVVVRYEGTTLSNDIFDSAVNPVTFDLTTLVPGWRKVLPQFNVAEDFVENGDGTVSFINQGIGVMFLPSGLAYFGNAVTGIAAYSPIIFKFGLLQMSENDHDNDGIPSYLEDLNGDGEYALNTSADERDGDDTDADGAPNYFDNDDDGDGILTNDEIEIKTYNRATLAEINNLVLEEDEVLIGTRKEGDGTYTGTTTIDTDKDGIADYLDSE